MSKPLPHLPPQFAKLAALYRSSTFDGERDTARRKAEAMLPPDAGGFDRALRIQAYHDAMEKGRGNVFAGFDEFQEIDDPGYIARQRAAAAEKLRLWHERRAALVKQFGSLEAVLAPCDREKALTNALKPWRVPDKAPHQRWTWELKGWGSLDLAKKMPADMRAAVEGAMPMPTTIEAARAELAYWRERDEDMVHALGENGQYLGDSGLDRVAVARMEIIRDLVEHAMPLHTAADIAQRMRDYRWNEMGTDVDVEDALLRDLEALADREATAPSSRPTPTSLPSPSEGGRTPVGLAAAAPPLPQPARSKSKREPSPWPTWGTLSHFGRLGMFEEIVAQAALTDDERKRLGAAQDIYRRQQIPPSTRDQRTFNAACRNLWERGWRPEEKAA